MGFQSFSFLLLFLPAVVVIDWALRKRGLNTGRKGFLLLASLAFYALSSVETLPILLGSLVVNWFLAHRIQGTAQGLLRRRWLQLGISLNVVLLVVFKYAHFLAENIGALTAWHPDLPAFALPLGISFFTIQQVIYLIDCHEEMTVPAQLLEHAIFISFFPYIVAGPIVHAKSLLPQFESSAKPSDAQLANGLMLFIIGLCKKAVLADTFGRFADAGFSAATPLGTAEGWITSASYTFQMYFDFSGYSDMAVGVGLMLGLILPENFNSPFKAASIIDYWKRWHLTLTNFITTYLYTPMIRSMRPLTFPKAMLSTVLAMSIAGIWHGAAWTFLVFGLMHGLALVVNHYWRKAKLKLPWPLAWGLTFSFVMVSLTVFRADGWAQANAVLSSMLGMHGTADRGVFASIPFLDRSWSYLIMLGGAAIAFAAPNSNQLAREFKPSWRWCAVCAATLIVSLLFLNNGATKVFIYRDF